MRRIVAIITTIALLFILLPTNKVFAQSYNYYVDSVNGNDNNNGTTPQSAWQSLNKVNQMTFQPGDAILLKAGCTWSGKLHPLGSGESENHIRIDMYGEGNKPIINGEGVTEGTVCLINQQYWSINNLEITNNGNDEPRKQGIYVKNDCVGTLNSICISNCYLHDITGILKDMADGKESGGIVFSITNSNSNIPSKWNDIKIQNNVIKNVAREGIVLQSSWINKPQYPNSNWDGCLPYYASTDILIEDNELVNIAGDGIIPWCVDGALIQRNYVERANNHPYRQFHAGIWPYFCENIIFQYNECCNTQNIFDGMAFDFDNGNINCIYQYNYSHDNEGGFLLMCCDGYGEGNIARYNISENDGCAAFSRVFQMANNGNHNYSVYNNTIYVKNHNPLVFYQEGGSSINFNNNIFINRG